MLRSFNNTVVTLVPKIKQPATIKDFRPIACCTIMYKIISKVITGRLQEVLDGIVCQNQSAFIPGRLISDSIILSHELVDLQKAYDTVEWPFIEQMLGALGFPQKISWIMRCIQTRVSKISNADKEKLNKFLEASGLKANMNKSQMYFGGVDRVTMDRILNILGYEKGELSVKYLGVPLSTKKLTVQQHRPLAEKITARITNWMAKSLSYAGRLQLIRSVLFGMQAYWTQLFLMPKKVIKMIEAICRSYPGSGQAVITKKSLVAWKKICVPKGAGGLNLLNLKVWSQAAICKLLWALSQQKEKLWIT
ncbi:unnamed protein product [Withania somnifera]